MVALLVRLKLRLLRNSLRRSAWRLVGLILGSLYALAIVAFVIVGLVALRFADVAIAASVTTLAFGALTIGWLIMSLLVFGVDETVDPARFALLPVRAPSLVPGLLAAALIGLPGVATLLVALGLLGTWSIGIAPIVATVVAIALGVPLCALWSRAITSVFAQFLSSRRFRDVAIVALTLVLVSFGLVGNLIGNVAGEQDSAALLALLHRAGDVIGWTPFGWVWAVPGLVAQGRWGSAALHLLLAIALVVALWVVWLRALERNLTSPLENGGDAKAIRSGTGLQRLYPQTPAGAVAIRCLHYWRRDPRYLASLVALMIVPLILVASQALSPNNNTAIIALAPVVLALMAAPSMASDLAYDGSAVSLHVLSGMAGRDDRSGRVMAVMTLLVPVLVVMLIVCALISQRWDLLVRAVALTVTLLLAGLGVAMWVGTVVPGKAPPPGSSPFASNSSGGLKGIVSFGMATGLSVVCAVPTIALVVVSIWFPWIQWVALPVGIGVGVVALSFGIRLGGSRLDHRWPELLAEVSVTP